MADYYVDSALSSRANDGTLPTDAWHDDNAIKNVYYIDNREG